MPVRRRRGKSTTPIDVAYIAREQRCLQHAVARLPAYVVFTNAVYSATLNKRVHDRLLIR